MSFFWKEGGLFVPIPPHLAMSLSPLFPHHTYKGRRNIGIPQGKKDIWEEEKGGLEPDVIDREKNTRDPSGSFSPFLFAGTKRFVTRENA